MVVGWYVLRGLFRITYRILAWVLVTENMSVRSKLKKVFRVGKPYGDEAKKIRFENGHWTLTLSNPRFRMEVVFVEFRVEKKTGRLRIFALRDQRMPFELTYDWIGRFIPYDCPITMHVDYAAYMYSQLRHNVL